MAHVLIVGMTESGKSQLAKQTASHLKRRGHGVLTIDPINDPEWHAVSDFCTSDIYQYLDIVKRSESCFLFVDEGGENCGHHDQHAHWLATRSRHYGHSAFFIAQRATQIAPLIRGQCRYLYMFNSPLEDSKTLANEFNNQDLIQGNKLKQFEYLYCGRFDPVKKGVIKPTSFGTNYA